MHEMSLAGSVLQIVEAAAFKDAFVRVRSLRLSVPALAGVEVDALRFALHSLAPETVMDGAEFIIDEPASAARCLDCNASIEVDSFEAHCPVCGGDQWRSASDRGLRVIDLLVE